MPIVIRILMGAAAITAYVLLHRQINEDLSELETRGLKAAFLIMTLGHGYAIYRREAGRRL